MKPLTEVELHRSLAELLHWKLEAGQLARTFEFSGFLEAIAFVNRIADLAERQNHHPDVDIRYNKVRLGLITHDANGITRRDVDFARSSDLVVSPL